MQQSWRLKRGRQWLCLLQTIPGEVAVHEARERPRTLVLIFNL
jgi:hypothetical protein